MKEKKYGLKSSIHSSILILTMLFLCLFSCNNSINQEENNKEVNYNDIVELIEQNKKAAAVRKLEKIWSNNSIIPMDLIQDSNLYQLVLDPSSRPLIRDKIKQYTFSDSVNMVNISEPGNRIEVNGLIVDDETDDPIQGVQVELFQVDNKGLYFEEKSTFNPRLFGYVITDFTGKFYINSIKPVSYKDDNGDQVTPHIHFNLTKEGYRSYNSEFIFTDEPLYRINGNTENLPIANKDSLSVQLSYHVKIRMQKSEQS